MKNIEIVLRNDCTTGSGDLFRLHFGLEEANVVALTSTNEKDKTQHDYTLEKEDYLFLRERLDKHFDIHQGGR